LTGPRGRAEAGCSRIAEGAWILVACGLDEVEYQIADLDPAVLDGGIASLDDADDLRDVVDEVEERRALGLPLADDALDQGAFTRS